MSIGLVCGPWLTSLAVETAGNIVAISAAIDRVKTAASTPDGRRLATLEIRSIVRPFSSSHNRGASGAETWGTPEALARTLENCEEHGRRRSRRPEAQIAELRQRGADQRREACKEHAEHETCGT
jgi:hypothetical protein